MLRLETILKEKGISNVEFARRMGKTPQYTNSIVKERAAASVAMLSKMAEVLNVPMSDLFNN